MHVIPQQLQNIIPIYYMIGKLPKQTYILYFSDLFHINTLIQLR